MHNSEFARETLHLLWSNYVDVSEQVTPEFMTSEVLHSVRKEPLRPFEIATWLARYGFLISAWTLWEHYARRFCESLPATFRKKSPHESNVQWINGYLIANSKTFTNFAWFNAANRVRNLIAHDGGRIDAQPNAAVIRADAQAAFPGIGTWKEGYLKFENDHVAILMREMTDFINEHP